MQSRWKRTRRSIAIPIAGLGVAVAPAPASAQEDASAPIVSLDQLLKLPDSLVVEPVVRGGATRAEWRSRFEAARRDRDEARAALARTQAKLEGLAGESSAWKMGIPGLGNVESGSNEGPLDYAISTEMKRNRAEVERAERKP
ncbi:MAG: hypothetical protein ACE5FL_14295, partial [Myxococcota bacterium]